MLPRRALGGVASRPTACHLVRLRRVRRAVEHEHRSVALSADGPDVLLDEELLLSGRPFERHLRDEGSEVSRGIATVGLEPPRTPGDTYSSAPTHLLRASL